MNSAQHQANMMGEGMFPDDYTLSERKPDLPVENEQTYLGDGLYASFDGFQLILRAPRGPGGDHVVALEPALYQALNAWVDRYPRLKRHLKGERT